MWFIKTFSNYPNNTIYEYEIYSKIQYLKSSKYESSLSVLNGKKHPLSI